MPSLTTRIIGAVVLALLVAVAALYVLQLGPFNPRPSTAAKALPKVQGAVAKAQGQQGAAVAEAEIKTNSAAVAAEKKAERHVDQIRKSTARAVPADVPDAEFYRGVCDTQLYAGDPACRGFGGQP